jgi:glycosyltransferase involved in cell wall biosynthesis
VVEDGVTGRIVEDLDGAVAAVLAIDDLPRPAVRAAFERRFTAGRMADDYLDLYRRLIG